MREVHKNWGEKVGNHDRYFVMAPENTDEKAISLPLLS